MTTLGVTVSAAPFSGVSVTFTVNARRRWRRNEALPLALSGTEKDTTPAFSGERSSRPTRTCRECRALANDARAASRLTSSRPPEVASDTLIDPCTLDPRCSPASLSALDLPSTGEPLVWLRALVVVGLVVVVVEVVVVGGVPVVPPPRRHCGFAC